MGLGAPQWSTWMVPPSFQGLHEEGQGVGEGAWYACSLHVVGCGFHVTLLYEYAAGFAQTTLVWRTALCYHSSSQKASMY
jgi:hypothetical protein